MVLRDWKMAMNQRRQHGILIVLLAIVPLLPGCAEAPSAAAGAVRLQPIPFTAVSTMDPLADVSSAVSFTWAPRMQEIDRDPYETGIPDREALESAITAALEKKGYEYTWRSSADLKVGYLVVTNDALSSEQISKRFGVQPGLNLQAPDDVRYEKGTLVVDIIDVKTGGTVWRGALQGFADLEISKEDRQERLDDMVMFMLARFPARAGLSH
jgi:hypothetical protein